MPLLTVAGVLVLLGIAAIPFLSLDLALPDNSTAPAGSQQRQTYDAITREFGEGYNAPLSVSADIITSTDPEKTVDQLVTKVSAVPDVVDILQATPNPEADTGLVAVVPREGQTAASTSQLVQQLRDDSPGWEDELGVSEILVAGTTAVNIDVSQRLGDALLPFGALVIGLSVGAADDRVPVGGSPDQGDARLPALGRGGARRRRGRLPVGVARRVRGPVGCADRELPARSS